MEDLSDTLLNQLYRTNCPIRYEDDNDRYIIDVRAAPSANFGLRFICPFCLERKGSMNGFKQSGNPYTNSISLFHNHGQGYGTRANTCSLAAKKYYNLTDKNYEFNLVKDISYVSNPFK